MGIVATNQGIVGEVSKKVYSTVLIRINKPNQRKGTFKEIRTVVIRNVRIVVNDVYNIGDVILVVIQDFNVDRIFLDEKIEKMGTVEGNGIKKDSFMDYDDAVA